MREPSRAPHTGAGSPRLAVSCVVVLLLLCSACGGWAPSAAVSASEGDALPACGKPPSPDPNPLPAGALLPGSGRVTAVRHNDRVVQLNGYVEMTPSQMRTWVQRRPGVSVDAAAEEAGVVELLVSNDQWHAFIRAKAVCADASAVAQVIAPAGSHAVLPTPGETP